MRDMTGYVDVYVQICSSCSIMLLHNCELLYTYDCVRTRRHAHMYSYAYVHVHRHPCMISYAYMYVHRLCRDGITHGVLHRLSESKASLRLRD